MEKEQKKSKKKSKISKEVLNIIRTTMRNNIELTHIADNKANVLLSLNALMLTFLLPIVIPHFETLKQFKLVIPFAIIVLTSTIVIYISTLVLKPGKFFAKQKAIEEGRYMSPFFFGNFYKMDLFKYREYISDAVSDNELIKDHIAEDLHYIGTRLGRKMSLIRIAFNIFLFGIILSIVLSTILVIYFSSI